MTRGHGNRAVGSHDMNEHSSRSHSITTLTCRGKNNVDQSTTYGELIHHPPPTITLQSHLVHALSHPIHLLSHPIHARHTNYYLLPHTPYHTHTYISCHPCRMTDSNHHNHTINPYDKSRQAPFDRSRWLRKNK